MANRIDKHANNFRILTIAFALFLIISLPFYYFALHAFIRTWVADIGVEGPIGPIGPIGPMGLQGPNGTDGAVGIQGPPGNFTLLGDACTVIEFVPAFPSSTFAAVVVNEAYYRACENLVDVYIAFDATTDTLAESTQITLPLTPAVYTTQKVIGTCNTLDVDSTGRVSLIGTTTALASVLTTSTGAKSVGIHFTYLLDTP